MRLFNLFPSNPMWTLHTDLRTVLYFSKAGCSLKKSVLFNTSNVITSTSTAFQYLRILNLRSTALQVPDNNLTFTSASR